PLPPLGLAALALLAGVGLAQALPLSAPEAAAGALGLALCAGWAALRSPRLAPPALLLGLALLGAARVDLQPAAADGLALDGAAVRGRVRSIAGARALVDTEAGPLRLLMSAPRPEIGAEIAALVGPAEPEPTLPGALPGDLADQLGRAPMLRARRHLRLGGPPGPGLAPPALFSEAAHGPLLRALLTGDRTGVPAEQLELLRRTGTSHLLSVSGLHVALIGGMWATAASALLRPPLRRKGRGWARAIPLLIGLFGALCFAAAVGMPVSAQRAAVMGGLGALAVAAGREVLAGNALGAAVLIVVMVDPRSAAEPAAWLSFGAVLGMATLGPLLLRLLPPDPPVGLRPFLQSVGASLGATLGTLPPCALIFQELPPLSPVANLFAGPPISVVVMPAVALAPLLPEAAARALIGVADPVMGAVLEGLRLLPDVRWHPTLSAAGALALGASLLLTRRAPLVPAAVALLTLGLRAQPAVELEVWFLQIGQGDAALLRFPDGRRWLVDGGPPGDKLTRWLRMRGDDHIDAIFLSHPHPDHMGGLQGVLEQLEVGALIVPRPPEADEGSYLELWRAAFAKRVPVRGPDALPAAPPAGSGAAILHPRGWAGRGSPRVNDESIVLHLRYGERSILFAGDVEERAERHLGPRLPRVDVLKVAHHGSKTSSHPPLVAAARPSFAVISCGVGNRYGHPHAEALGRLRGVRLLRTDRDGTVVLRTDGRNLRWSGWTPEAGWAPLDRAPWAPRAAPEIEAALAAAEAEDAAKHSRRLEIEAAKAKGEPPPPKSKKKSKKRSGGAKKRSSRS
ncbi:MAG: ComEC/Rec2 family competence protein, partial [Deltaproteobacteria bacterium]|nr:ComEC/Rec2 family competence protein [Deltaproteobacteria bacterium]